MWRGVVAGPMTSRSSSSARTRGGMGRRKARHISSGDGHGLCQGARGSSVVEEKLWCWWRCCVGGCLLDRCCVSPGIGGIASLALPLRCSSVRLRQNNSRRNNEANQGKGGRRGGKLKGRKRKRERAGQGFLLSFSLSFSLSFFLSYFPPVLRAVQFFLFTYLSTYLNLRPPGVAPPPGRARWDPPLKQGQGSSILHVPASAGWVDMVGPAVEGVMSCWHSWGPYLGCGVRLFFFQW
jgi:hypothetical protein